MKLAIVAVLLLASYAVAVTPGDQGTTIMAPHKDQGTAGPGETTLGAAGANPDDKPKGELHAAKILDPRKENQCGCCGQQVCGCCQQPQPQFIAPEIKEEAPKCGCQPTAGMCPNTCGCCATHVAPEIKQENTCNCCHLDACGCCKKETVAPEQRDSHVAPEIREKPACPCAAQKISPCPCAASL
eukprot:TRINITY_DN80287_c0_g1_i1.p2 TRINITY_DN80287_c0_g1~~TRINITY_DN80287_c0_g1_i1.p2  ORF type:complete len:197 (+),score=25.31 TRINITY_DN80287_c0_g1_i1:39-593(+)